MYFEIIGEIEGIEPIAIGGSIRDIARLRRRYGAGLWRKLKGTATVRLTSGAVHRAELHWYEAHGIGRVKFKIKEFLAHMKHQKKQFALCVRNEGAEDLEIRKIYQILPDARAAKDKHIRVIDESGEDYLYPADYFVPLTLPREVERAFSAPTR